MSPSECHYIFTQITACLGSHAASPAFGNFHLAAHHATPRIENLFTPPSSSHARHFSSAFHVRFSVISRSAARRYYHHAAWDAAYSRSAFCRSQAGGRSSEEIGCLSETPLTPFFMFVILFILFHCSRRLSLPLHFRLSTLATIFRFSKLPSLTPLAFSFVWSPLRCCCHSQRRL